MNDARLLEEKNKNSSVPTKVFILLRYFHIMITPSSSQTFTHQKITLDQSHIKIT